jgi:hypothetical protein
MIPNTVGKGMGISLLLSDEEEVTLVNTDCPSSKNYQQGFSTIVVYVFRLRLPSVLWIQ